MTDALFYPLAQHHRFISFSIYTWDRRFFVLNLRKGHYKFQFSQLAFTHMVLLFVVFQANFIACSIFEGLFSGSFCPFVWSFVMMSWRTSLDFFLRANSVNQIVTQKTWEGFGGLIFNK